jgi:hypothetical protein
MVKYLFPPYWLYALTLKPAFWLLGKLFRFPMWALRKTKPKGRIAKLIWGAAVVWVAIPGTVPWSILQLAKFVGYEKEADAILNTAKTVLMAAWEAGKFAFRMMS